MSSRYGDNSDIRSSSVSEGPEKDEMLLVEYSEDSSQSHSDALEEEVEGDG